MRLEHEPRGEVGQDPGPKGPGRIVGKQRERLLQHAGRAGATGVSEVVRLLWEQLGAARGVVGGDRRDRQIDQRQCALPVSGVAERGRRPGEQIGPASPCDLDGVRQLVPHLQGSFAQGNNRSAELVAHYQRGDAQIPFGLFSRKFPGGNSRVSCIHFSSSRQTKILYPFNRMIEV